MRRALLVLKMAGQARFIYAIVVNNQFQYLQHSLYKTCFRSISLCATFKEYVFRILLFGVDYPRWLAGLTICVIPRFALCWLLLPGGLLYPQRRSGSTGHIPDERALPPNLRGAACLRQAPPAVGGVDYGGQKGVPRGAGVCGAHEHPRRHPGEAAAAPRADARVRAFLAAGMTCRSPVGNMTLESTN